MAWIKMQNSVGTILDLPEPVFNNFFKDKAGFKVVQESKPSSLSKKEKQIKEEVIEDGNIQESQLDESKVVRKTTKKTTK